MSERIPGQTDLVEQLAEMNRKPVDRVALACERVRECFTEAERLNQLRHAWYARMDRVDVLVLLQYAEAQRAA